MRRILNQCANAAVKQKGSIFEIVYHRLVPRLGHNKTIGAVAHRLCRLIWIILHKGVRHEERGPAVSEKSRRARTLRMIRTLRNLGYRVEPLLAEHCRYGATDSSPTTSRRFRIANHPFGMAWLPITLFLAKLVFAEQSRSG